MPFDSPDINLGELLKDVGCGKIRLPDFQRDWKWDTDRIAGLLASVSLGYPVGVVMLLETGGGDVQFATRAVSGVAETDVVNEADRLILDGQQRLTSLYQSLASDRVVQTQDTRKKKMERWFYLDIDMCLGDEADREDAVLAVPEDRVVRTNFAKDVVLDVSSVENEWETGHFPLSRVFDMGGVFKWANGYGGIHGQDKWTKFYDRVLNNIIHYTVPVIVLKKETPREAVCTVFEKVNTGGVVLDVFELLTATFAASHFDLREDWNARRKRLFEHKVLRGMENTDFLQAVTLLATRERRMAWAEGDSDKAPAVSCRRADILRLTQDDYQKWAPKVELGFAWAAKFLSSQCIFEARDVPYRTQLVPLAAMHVALGPDAEKIGVVDKIRRWYWCGVLGELYGGAIETRFGNDLQQVTAWVGGAAEEPITVYESSFDPGRLLTLRTRNSAAYKGIYALLMAKGSKDWLFDQDITLASHHNLAVDIHHIFPKAWCEAKKVDDLRRESIVNKTGIAADTNRHAIRAKAPSKYVKALAIAAGVSDDVIQKRIAGHQIGVDHLLADDFDAFFTDRRRRLLDLIGDAMGREITDAAADAAPAADEYDLDEEEPSDDDIEEAVA